MFLNQTYSEHNISVFSFKVKNLKIAQNNDTLYVKKMLQI